MLYVAFSEPTDKFKTLKFKHKETTKILCCVILDHYPPSVK